MTTVTKTDSTQTELGLPPKELLLNFITTEWMCVMYGKGSLLGKVLEEYGLADTDGTRAGLRARLTELTRDGSIICDNRLWTDPTGGPSFHHSQCRRV
ncbi:MAG: hypothetical protein MUF19_01435 [Candidatus Pacebacteria bacterium]|jgi:hypothetical protein|nr:hypothetical protein [Candidatus Paceibacterota bacterium]